ncbi:hypothetical protein KR084_002525, partial [Drosophila pseudotakahashii]
SQHMDVGKDHAESTKQNAQTQSPSDGDLQSAEASEQDALLDEIQIKSEPFCEDLWDVLDELGDILDEEQAEVLAKNQADLQNEELAESEVDENPATPPPPSISLTDDFSLFTRRERVCNEVSPASFNESLQESGEISSSEESVPIRSISSPQNTLVELRSSPEENPERCRSRTVNNGRFSLETPQPKGIQVKPKKKNTRSKSKERKHAHRKSPSIKKKCVSRSPSVKLRGRRRSRSRSSPEAKRRSSPATHRRRRSQSRDHKRSRRRSYSRERQERRRRPPSPRRRLRSRSRSRDRSSRSRSIRNGPPNRRSRDASPSIRHRHSPFRPRPRSLRFVWRDLRRHSPERRPRHLSRSTSRPAKSLVRQRLGNKVWPREHTRSTSPPAKSPLQKRSRSRSKSAKITQRVKPTHSRSPSKSRSRSKNKPPKTVARKRSCSRSKGPEGPIRERPRSSSPPTQKHPKKPLAEKSTTADRVANAVEAKLPQDREHPLPDNTSPISSISPRPISPMVTLHDNRISRPEGLRKYLLATPPAPHVLYTETQYTDMEYSAHHYPGYLPGPYGRPPPELGPFDLRRRLATTRTLCYLRPNDLRHRIQDMYAPPPAFNAYAEWPTGYPGQYHPSGYY